MALLRMKTWIDGHTGDVLSHLGHRPNEHAVPAASDVCAPGRLPGLDALPGGVTLMLDTRVHLRPFRLDRDARPHLAERRYAYTCQELKAAFAHPDVTRERIAEGTDPPERGRRLALYDALAGWIAHIEREWRDRAPGEAMVGPAHEVLDPVLLDLYGECSVTLSDQCTEWVQGTASQIPESAAREAERCLRAALDAHATALQRSLDDQLGALGAREEVEHWCSIAEPPRAPNALQCACRLLGAGYDDPRGHRVLWRPAVALASSAERVRVELRGRDTDLDPVTIDVDPASVELVIAAERTTHAHDGDIERLRAIGEAVADKVRATVTQARKDEPTRAA